MNFRFCRTNCFVEIEKCPVLIRDGIQTLTYFLGSCQDTSSCFLGPLVDTDGKTITAVCKLNLSKTASSRVPKGIFSRSLIFPSRI